jgi:hypothetical protein
MVKDIDIAVDVVPEQSPNPLPLLACLFGVKYTLDCRMIAIDAN